MAKGNTIGRMVGQGPASKSPPDMANPLVTMSQGLQQMVSAWQGLSGLVQQIMGLAKGAGGGGGGGAPGGAPGPAAGAPRGAEDGASGGAPGAALDLARGVGDLSQLASRLTALGATLRPGASTLEGPPDDLSRAVRTTTDAIVSRAVGLQANGRSVHQLDLDAAQADISRLAGALPSPVQATQALDAANTLARMQGASGPVLQMLQQVLGVFQQALQLMQKIKPGTDGAKVRG